MKITGIDRNDYRQSRNLNFDFAYPTNHERAGQPDENGGVDLHRGVAPEGDDPNDIMRQDFGTSPLISDEAKKNQLSADRVEPGNRHNFAGQYASNQ